MLLRWMTVNRLSISTVTPVYRGAEYLSDLVEALADVQSEVRAGAMPVDIMEAIFVDDGAVDRSAELLEELQRKYSWIHLIHLARNFGQHAATVAGILHASGDWIATLDEDLQHHPKHLVPMLLRAIETRSDVVYGASDRSVHHSGFRNLSSVMTKTTVGWLAGDDAVRRFTSFRMIRGSVARAAGSVATHDTYFDVVLTWFTNRIATLQLPLVDIRSVAGGKSGYSLKRLLLHARRMLISAGIRPLRIASALGVLTLATSVVISIYICVLKLLRPAAIDLKGWASLILAISFFGGLTAFLLGIVLEYLSTVVQHILGKPTFFVVDRSKDTILMSVSDPPAPS
jgi:glycosyltransferase involved in cell wall biosynthesis